MWNKNINPFIIRIIAFLPAKVSTKGVFLMQLSSNEKIINILEKTLNYIDRRLVGHGKRVSFLTFKMLENKNIDKKILRDITLLAMVHDIGAYETAEIDDMFHFEAKNMWEHSVYGYLFFKYFSPLKSISQIVLYHHANIHEIKNLSPEYVLIAQALCIANMADLFYLSKRSTKEFESFLQNKRGTCFLEEAVDLYIVAKFDLLKFDEDIKDCKEYNKILYDIPFTNEEIEEYIRLIVYAIDFRSTQTVVHTISVASIAETLAKIAGASKQEIDMVRTAALLHDIGKISTPVRILEGKASTLSESDMEIMRHHIVVSGEILEGNVNDVVKKIACRHHERLDGSGYPEGLFAKGLTFLERLMCVADVFSALCTARSYQGAFPKEKIISILSDLAERNKMDKTIVDLVITHYDEIIEIGNKEAEKVVNDYNLLKCEYEKIINEIKK